jgi:hypothetical protein
MCTQSVCINISIILSLYWSYTSTIYDATMQMYASMHMYVTGIWWPRPQTVPNPWNIIKLGQLSEAETFRTWPSGTP